MEIKGNVFIVTGGASGLGEGTARMLAQQGGTVVIATHDLDFAEQVSDDVAMMFDSEIACMEPPADFFADNVFYRA